MATQVVYRGSVVYKMLGGKPCIYGTTAMNVVPLYRNSPSSVFTTVYGCVPRRYVQIYIYKRSRSRVEKQLNCAAIHAHV